MALYTFLVRGAAEGTENDHCPGPALSRCHLSSSPLPSASSLQPPACASASSSPQTRDLPALVRWDTDFLFSYFISTREGGDLSLCLLPTHGLSLGSPTFSLNPARPIPDVFPLLAASLLALGPQPCAQGSSLTLCFHLLWLPQRAAIQCPQCFHCFIHNVTITPRISIQTINVLIKALVISHLCL